MRKDIRLSLHAVLNHVRPHFGAILSKDWLKTTRVGKCWLIGASIVYANNQAEEPDFARIRQAYIPEVILAFDHILRLAGSILSRDNILECINLSTIVAGEDSDLAELFVNKGRMAELVDTFASDSLLLLVVTGPTKTKGGVSRQLRKLGWKRDVWALGTRQE